MTLLIIIGALIVLIALVSGGIVFAQTWGRVSTVLRIQALDIDVAHKTAALAYFCAAAKQVPLWRTLRDSVMAPIVLFFPLLRLPRDADDLPDSLEYWRNNVGINGDGWGWHDAQGNWHQCRDEQTPAGITAVSYNDPAYKGDAYYAPGHSPRSWYARWKWLAWRNVATKRLQDAGPLVQVVPTLLAGSPITDSSAPGFALFWNGVSGAGAAYQWHCIDRFGPLTMWTNVGCKLDIPSAFPELLPCRATITGTWLAFKRGASQP